jgi:EPS-associated MarR family transcriptional regulator
LNAHHHDIADEARYRLLTHLAAHPEATQRQLAQELGISLGKVNYCLRALIEKGLVKARNFKNSSNKAAYAYVLTPRGLEEKIEVTYAFLRRKIAEYAAIASEIERLSAEVRDIAPLPAETASNSRENRGARS